MKWICERCGKFTDIYEYLVYEEGPEQCGQLRIYLCKDCRQELIKCFKFMKKTY